MSTVTVGSNQKYADNWSVVFERRKAAGKKGPSARAKKKGTSASVKRGKKGPVKAAKRAKGKSVKKSAKRKR